VAVGFLKFRKADINFRTKSVEVKIIFSFDFLVQFSLVFNQVPKKVLSHSNRVECVEVVVFVVNFRVKLGLNFQQMLVFFHVLEELSTHSK